LVERLNGIEEVRGSNPLGSTPFDSELGSDREGWEFDGDFTQPVFNDQHGLIRTASPTPPLFRSRCPFLIEIKRIVYQARA
jgi:hypothetical protein